MGENKGSDIKKVQGAGGRGKATRARFTAMEVGDIAVD
jgi:hypothetical protein